MEFILIPPNNPVFLSIGEFSIRYYGLIMAFSFFVGIFFSYFIFIKKKLKTDAELFLDYSPAVIFFSILGARMFYVFASLEFYIANPGEIFLINHGGLSIFGAIFFGIVSLFVLSKIKKFDFLQHIDVVSITLPFCQAIGRYGNFFNQEAYGAPTNFLLKMFVSSKYRKPELINVEYYHPTFLYESILDILIFGIITFIYFKNKNLKNGSFACIYLILYSFIRFIIEGIRIDSILNIASIPIARIICVVLFLISFILLFLLNKKAPNKMDA